jgi:hypothetical protein
VRPIIILVLIIIGLAMARMLFHDVSKAIGKALGPNERKKKRAKSEEPPPKGGKLVRDPETGSFVEEPGRLRQKAGLGPILFVWQLRPRPRSRERQGDSGNRLLRARFHVSRPRAGGLPQRLAPSIR